MIQGLSLSGLLHGLLPYQTGMELKRALTLAFSSVEPQWLACRLRRRRGDLATNLQLETSLDTASVQVRAWKIQAMLRSGGKPPDDSSIMEVFIPFQSDEELLLLLDWLDGRQGVPLALYVDDLRMRASSPEAALRGTSTLSTYATQGGVVFECGDGTSAPLPWRD